jgi:iron complex transport system ATP-binding protein
MPEQNSYCQINHLNWSPKHQPILKDISFAITKKQVVSIIGPNGAGKTSLLRCITRQIRDYQGDIMLAGQLSQHYSRTALAKKVAVVAQINEPVFQLNVYDVVKMGLVPHKQLFSLDNQTDDNAINAALAKTDLLNLAKHQFSTLSGGEQQRALIARALVQQAEFLILDEPTNHLDVYYQHQILQLICSLGLTVLLTIHDINLASEYSDQIAVMKQGKLIAYGSPQQIARPELLSEVFEKQCLIEPSTLSNGAPRLYFTKQNIADHNNGVEHETY